MNSFTDISHPVIHRERNETGNPGNIKTLGRTILGTVIEEDKKCVRLFQ